ncbi:DUF4132 domain-containing protein [Oculatella sp. LEGE 06141]|uniref:DUF5724 domain-containing protein n=1 Tax=Oculatella sp. LEGE 06141 TaxID=1828648 RepID=UPI00188044BC|nr:DUF5724 domain-containing protein [Oculatella sp. LEGE 06141]MBE9178027.1 DUF4132 domain-containing protein [Oculatella sp. LEGE 06141]
MLSREVAQAQLQKLYSADWQSQRIEQLSHLPERLRTFGYGILGRDAAGQRLDSSASYQVQEDSLQQLDQLALDDRLQIFSVLFPKFAATVEAAWQLLTQLPYQSGYSRRSFRAPTCPELSATRRHQWLQKLIGVTEGYDQDLEWFAAWTPYLSYYAADVLGILFAAAINQNDELGQTLFEVLTASASGNHEIGAMGRHITRALLVANRPDGWEFVERLLLAAQRQEGLRQTILETIDEAHPIAFQRMLRLILEQKLTRFSATIRAVDVWFGFGLESLDEKTARSLISQVLELLEHPDAQAAALTSEDPQLVYLALWAAGFVDAIAAINLVVPLLDHANATHQFVAVHFLAQLEITPARFMLLSALGDRDLAVVTAAVQALARTGDSALLDSDLFERLEQVLPHFPAKPQTRSLVWEWVKLEPSQTLVASALLSNLGQRSPKRLIPYLSLLDSYGRSSAATLLSEIKPWDAEIRATLFQLLSDASSWVRERVIRLLQHCEIAPAESIQLEQLLTRTASDLRRGILGLLLSQPDEAAIASAERLLVAKKAPQRQAGLELVRELVQQNRQIDRAHQLATDYQTRSKLTTTETQLLTGILQSETEATLTDALGLVQVAALTPIAPPQVITATQIVTTPAVNCLLALDELIHQHRQTPVKIIWNGEEEELLGNLKWKFPHVDPKRSPAENLEHLPLSDVWLNWWRDRDAALRDVDGLELIRALVPRFNFRPDPFDTEQVATNSSSLVDRVLTDLQAHTGQTPSSLRYPHQIDNIIRWLLYLHPPDQVFDYFLDAIATLLHTIPTAELKTDPQWSSLSHWGANRQVSDFISYWIGHARFYLAAANSDQRIRWWQLVRWVDRHLPNHRAATTLWDVYNAYQLGGATEADVMFYLLGAEARPEGTTQPSGNAAEAKANLRTAFPDLSQLTRRNPPESYAAYPALLELTDRARQRILAIELQRGDLPTAATNAARALKSIVGMSTVIQLIQAFDRNKLVRHYTYNNLSKAAVFSHLMRISFPAAEDTPAEFSQRVQSAQIKPENLIQFAFYAPQWVSYIEQALGWTGFAEAVWWFHAHTKDNGWSVERDVRETWVAQISERTPLSAESLVDGAVDVDWFHRLYKLLQADRWNQLYEAAQYASSGAGHQRAKLFADAMLGNLDAESLRDRITQKRYQDAVRALGLLPLPKGKKRDPEILARYQALQEFLRTSKKFGSQRQASEKLAVSIGMENLARTAGFIDPQRLQWAMEAEAIADLTEQAQTVTIDQVSVSLAITAEGEPEVTVTKQGKPLKAIPAKLKKQPEIKALTVRKQDITQQASRIRISLEQAMCRGDRFTPAELVQLAKHPVLFPMLSQLVLMSDTESGYLVENGTALQNHSQVITPIASDELRIAHPHDLLMTQEWHLWQQDCFMGDRVQPFKQIFRELYVVTGAEHSATVSRRYEGHQVNPKQALALWGQRGWIAAPEEGVRRTFHAEGLIAEVHFLDGFYTPLELEGLTIAGVQFHPRDQWKSIPLNEVPPRLFSEVMRDLDLVVSVAHQGGVDPEATASTVEMRSALVRETCRLLKLPNVQLQGNHALIEGQLGSYSVHLGSAIVHRQPGGALCIVPVHSQHRGRLFLPFVDPDPKTAEVISKVLLLARDKEIQDPTILQQIL